MPTKKARWRIKNPTTRKVLNAGFTPACLKTNTGTRWGWIVSKRGSITRFAMITPNGQKIVRLNKRDARYLEIIYR